VIAPSSPVRALAAIAGHLRAHGRSFALVGGLAVSIRGEVRFTRDVDLAVAVSDDSDAEGLVHALSGVGYRPVAVVEHQAIHRLSTVRLMSPEGVVVDLLFASSGVESEIVERSEVLRVPDAGPIPVARTEELLAMKVLSMTDRRPHDRIDALGLLAANADLTEVRAVLDLIRARGYDREQDLEAKLQDILTQSQLG